jgi:hypothetical protein
MGHSTLAMVIRHYARWAHKPKRRSEVIANDTLTG